ncbi:MAG: hypothetical protein M0041_07720 [Nitrospiraceae bacterium]|nr:hypothetical protein [Nitrospiraceae bacterium]
MQKRMSRTSRQNIESADRAVVEKCEGGFMIRLEKQIDERGIPAFSSYVCNPEAPMLYPSIQHARRAIQGIRSGLPIECWEPVKKMA